jgi:hypothetical protein
MEAHLRAVESQGGHCELIARCEIFHRCVELTTTLCLCLTIQGKTQIWWFIIISPIIYTIYIYTGPFGAYTFYYRFPQSLVNIKPSVSWYPKIQWFNASFAPLKLPSIRGIQSILDTQIIPNHLTGWYHYITRFWLNQMIKKHIYN